MIAKEIRHVVRLTSANMDPALMFRQRLVNFEAEEPSAPRQLAVLFYLGVVSGQFHRTRYLKSPMWGCNIPNYQLILSNKAKKT